MYLLGLGSLVVQFICHFLQNYDHHLYFSVKVFCAGYAATSNDTVLPVMTLNIIEGGLWHEHRS